jgi:hypothetical protein
MVRSVVAPHVPLEICVSYFQVPHVAFECPLNYKKSATAQMVAAAPQPPLQTAVGDSRQPPLFEPLTVITNGYWTNHRVQHRFITVSNDYSASDCRLQQRLGAAAFANGGRRLVLKLFLPDIYFWKIAEKYKKDSPLCRRIDGEKKKETEWPEKHTAHLFVSRICDPISFAV